MVMLICLDNDMREGCEKHAFPLGIDILIDALTHLLSSGPIHRLSDGLEIGESCSRSDMPQST